VLIFRDMQPTNSFCGRSRSGFSIVSVMVAAVLAGFVAVAVSKIITGANQGQAQIQRNADFTILVASINSILSKPELCRQAFKTASGGDLLLNFSGALSEIIPAEGGQPAKQGLLVSSVWFGDSKILTNNEMVGPGLQIQNLGLVPSGVSPVPATVEATLPGDTAANTYARTFAALFVRAEMMAGAGGMQKKFEKQFPIEFLYDESSGEIGGCSIDGSLLSIYFETQTCEEGTVMIGFGPEGPVCESIAEAPGSKEFASFSQDLPEGYTPVTCSSNSGNRSVDYTCTGNKFKCEYSGSGWKLLKKSNDKVIRECGNGVTGVLAATETPVGKQDALPANVTLDTHEVSCIKNPRESKSCTSVGLQSPAQVGDCHQNTRNGTWMYVHKVGKNGSPRNTVCSGGMRAVAAPPAP